MSIATLLHSFEAPGQSASFRLSKKANVLIEGGTGTVQIEKSFDDVNFYVVSRDSAGTASSYSTSADSVAFNGVFEEPEVEGAYYRFNCTDYTSGTINCRISK